MKLSLRVVSAILLSFMLLFTSGMGPVESKPCEARSKTFQGVCLNGQKCASACTKEGSTGGRCSSLRCSCTRPC
ncbi:defensin-like protein 10 [Raphanus sativus]|uniref:Defensin-like protein 10 n=1 Tax=Raphanus sativus TaxID=3726 RepID=A0A6J0L8Q7_RAPSA|nr:defensin-like protein 10 [Raphanus sativus]